MAHERQRNLWPLMQELEDALGYLDRALERLRALEAEAQGAPRAHVIAEAAPRLGDVRRELADVLATWTFLAWGAKGARASGTGMWPGP